MTAISKITPLYAVLCEDVRVESNGKHIVIGVYTGNVVVYALPSTVQLTVWLCLEAKTPGHANVDVRGYDPSGRIMFSGEMEIESRESETITTSLPKFAVQIEKEGSIRVQVRPNGGRWKTIINKDVVFREKEAP